MPNIFNISYSANGEYLYVETDFNRYQICPDAIKGIGIYMEVSGSPNVLVKAYKGNKIITAIQYLMRKEMFIKQ